MRIINEKRNQETITFKDLEIGDVYLDKDGIICLKTANEQGMNSLAFDCFVHYYEELNSPVTPLNSELRVW